MALNIGGLINQIRPAVGQGRHYLLICPPKSGSTFLANTVAQLSGLPVATYENPARHRYTFDLGVARSLANQDAVIRVHARPHPEFLAWIVAKELKPVVLHRNICDSLVSMYDHRMRSSHAVDRQFRNLTRDSGLITTAYEWAAWYVGFDRQWQLNGRLVDCLHVQYEDFFPDVERTMPRILDHLEIAWTTDTLKKALDHVRGSRKRSNLNVGRSGRGVNLPPEVRRSINLLKASQ